MSDRSVRFQFCSTKPLGCTNLILTDDVTSTRITSLLMITILNARWYTNLLVFSALVGPMDLLITNDWAVKRDEEYPLYVTEVSKLIKAISEIIEGTDQQTSQAQLEVWKTPNARSKRRGRLKEESTMILINSLRDWNLAPRVSNIFNAN